MRPVAFVHGGKARAIRRAGGIVVAEEFYIAAERNGRDLPARPETVVKADEFGAKSDRKRQNPHPAQARDQEMPELVEKHDQAEHEQKGTR